MSETYERYAFVTGWAIDFLPENHCLFVCRYCDFEFSAQCVGPNTFDKSPEEEERIWRIKNHHWKEKHDVLPKDWNEDWETVDVWQESSPKCKRCNYFLKYISPAEKKIFDMVYETEKMSHRKVCGLEIHRKMH